MGSAFWPHTLSGYAAVFAVVFSAITTGLANMLRIRQKDIHVLVNGEHTRMKQELESITAERDQLRKTLPADVKST
jgi:hypothetical protein